MSDVPTAARAMDLVTLCGDLFPGLTPVTRARVRARSGARQVPPAMLLRIDAT
jgi:hypothetical protein